MRRLADRLAAAARAGRAAGYLGAVRRLGGANSLILPAPHAIAQSLYDDRSLLWSNFVVTAEEVLLGILVASAIGSRAVDRDPPLALAAPGDLPAAGRLADDSDSELRAAARAVARIRHRAEAGRDRAHLLLPDRRHHDLNALAPRRSGPDQADAELRRAAARTFCHVELPSALPGVLTGAKIAVAIAVIGAVLAELDGVECRTWLSFRAVRGATADAARLCRGADHVPVRDRAIRCAHVAERRVLPWAYETPRRHNSMKRLLPGSRLSLCISLALAACGAKQDKLTAAGAPSSRCR